MLKRCCCEKGLPESWFCCFCWLGPCQLCQERSVLCVEKGAQAITSGMTDVEDCAVVAQRVGIPVAL